MNLMTRVLNERGIMVAEVLVAAVILGLGLAALISVVPVESYAYIVTNPQDGRTMSVNVAGSGRVWSGP